MCTADPNHCPSRIQRTAVGGRLQSELGFAETERAKAWQLQAAQAEFLDEARGAEEAAKRQAKAAELEAGRLRGELARARSAEEAAKRRATAAESEAGRLRGDLARARRTHGGLVIPQVLLRETHVLKFLKVAFAPDKIPDLDMRAIAEPLMKHLTAPK